MNFARVVSFVFHPLLLTTYLVLFFGYWIPGILYVRQEQLNLFYVFIFGITFVFPALTILMFRQLGVIHSLTIEDRKERIFPFIFIALLYIVIVGLFFYRASTSGNFTKIMMIIAALATAAAICTLFFKISVHSLAWGGFLGIIFPLNRAVEGGLMYQILVIIVLLGLVASARLKLNAHSITEVAIGAGLGVAIGVGGMYWMF